MSADDDIRAAERDLAEALRRAGRQVKILDIELFERIAGALAHEARRTEVAVDFTQERSRHEHEHDPSRAASFRRLVSRRDEWHALVTALDLSKEEQIRLIESSPIRKTLSRAP